MMFKVLASTFRTSNREHRPFLYVPRTAIGSNFSEPELKIHCRRSLVHNLLVSTQDTLITTNNLHKTHPTMGTCNHQQQSNKSSNLRRRSLKMDVTGRDPQRNPTKRRLLAHVFRPGKTDAQKIVEKIMELNNRAVTLYSNGDFSSASVFPGRKTCASNRRLVGFR